MRTEVFEKQYVTITVISMTGFSSDSNPKSKDCDGSRGGAPLILGEKGRNDQSINQSIDQSINLYLYTKSYHLHGLPRIPVVAEGRKAGWASKIEP